MAETAEESTQETAEVAEQTTAEGEQGQNSAPAPAAKPDERDAELSRLRAQIEEFAPIVQAHKDAEEARKSEEQKLREALETAQREAAEARRVVVRAEVAEESGLSSDVVALLQGSSKDELLIAARKIAEQSAKRGGGIPSRPKPNVGSGTEAVDGPEVIDPAKLAAAIRKRLPY
jgi:hypothetical protein